MSTESSTRASRDEMFARAKERVAGFTPPAEWGTLVELEEDDPTGFFGRLRSTAQDPRNDPPRDKAFLFLDLDRGGTPAYFRYFYRLEQALKNVPIGAICMVVRGTDETTKDGNPVYTFNAVWEPSDDPLPEAAGSDDDLPF